MRANRAVEAAVILAGLIGGAGVLAAQGGGSTGPAEELTITLVGNAGVVLSDGPVTLLVDLPHEPGAFGYATYDPSGLDPTGDVVSVVTHAHRDHFSPQLFMQREGWRVVGSSAVVEGLPPDRIVSGDTVVIGAFTVIAVATPHSEGHRSYTIQWRGRSVHVTGDTEVGRFLPTGSPPDILFITPWLACSLAESAHGPHADRTILYHLRPDGSDRTCEGAEVVPRDTPIHLTAHRSPSAGREQR